MNPAVAADLPAAASGPWRQVPLTRPAIGAGELAQLAAVLDSGWLTQGPRVAAFEEQVARLCDSRYAVAVSSCTAALHLALLACGVQPGDEVVLPALSFVATANAVRYCGAIPVFVDIQPETLNIDVRAAEAAISPRTRAMLAVHQLGLPADMEPLARLARQRGLALIEDAACALGSRYQGRPLGNWGDAACLSFHPRKIITTGEGGMVLTRHAELAARVRRLRQHGMQRGDRARHEARCYLPEEYVELGYNYRLTDLQAAVGLAQLERLGELVSERRRLAQRYHAALAAQRWLRPYTEPQDCQSNYQSYAVWLDPAAPCRRDALLDALAAAGIGARPAPTAIHTLPPYRPWRPDWPLSHAEAAAQQALVLPLFPGMSEPEQDYVIEHLYRSLDPFANSSG
jgi:dTDP-4-amino-4,6-dideoxygalactose transaminase